ncbi:MAG TPA: DUF202 domain-containing protein [Beutenbergiaceae bacterium]|nr:DUF202 domain-containing protein [Beutenbergiaceae bacterium]
MTTQGNQHEHDQRRPASVYSVGSDPDARFSLANERTALAWLRTALALVAGGVALTTVSTLTGGDRLLDLLAGVSCIAGGVLAVNAILQWRRAERALRLGHPLPPPRLLSVLAVGIILIAVLLAGYALIHFGAW